MRSLVYVARARGNLRVGCSEVRGFLELPEFTLDVHESWEHGRSSKENISVNITRDTQFDNIETWIDGTPTGVNWQFIFELQDSPHPPVGLLEQIERRLGSPLRPVRP